MEVPQFILPSFVLHVDVFTSKVTFLTKVQGELERTIEISVNWQLKQID